MDTTSVPDRRVAVVGAGRLGRALVDALGAEGPFGHGFDGSGFDIVLLCVPDGALVPATTAIAAGFGGLLGHCSGATGLDALLPHEAFGLHPLMTVTTEGADFAGATAAVAGTTDLALRTARSLATRLGMRPVEIDESDRAAYHAAASIASNFLVTLEAAAERVGATTGLSREALVPLVRATVENWAAHGAEQALTGPIARGDDGTVRQQRTAVATRAPELLNLFDALADATRALAERNRAVTA